MALTQQLAYRRFLRSVFQAPARLTLSSGVLDVQVVDISLKGVLAELRVGAGTALPTQGGRGRLRLSLSATDYIAMDVAVARVQQVGPAAEGFGTVWQVGLQCAHIDLDSVTHLRQLIERNMQDPALLGRELAVLIGYSPDA
ncbi:PilZ domain-containing protein [Hylemonella sp. W303a]|uniref:PilZ domain-containing protein n=1 Tax=Hylemonella sp. W303a TaxID=3389873 RepID=UPI00396B047C